MAVAVIMPRQGQSVESCILTEWYKEIGDQVSKGDVLFAYETDKAAFEDEAQMDGILLARFFDAGDEVPVLVNVAVIGAEGEDIGSLQPDVSSSQTETGEPEPPVEAGATKVPQSVSESESAPGIEKITAGENGQIRISPRARKLAKEKRVVLEAIRGSGPGGRIIERDVLEEIKNGKRLTPLARKKVDGEGLAVPGEGNAPYGKIKSKDLVEPEQIAVSQGGIGAAEGYTDIPLSNVRKIIAAAMHRSLQNSAQLTHHLSANASKMLQLRKEVKNRMKDGYGYNITLNDMVCYAVIRALKVHPKANAQFLEGKTRQFNKVNLGLAVDTERGLLVPTLLDADDLSLPGLSTRLKELAVSCQGGSVSPDLLAPETASFTVSNLGNYGVEMFTPVINLPQVAILGVNTIIQRPTAIEDGSFGFQPFMGLSLTYDHRAIDGGPATQFLAEIKNQIEILTPDLL